MTSELVLAPRIDSQDAWAVRPPVRHAMVEAAEFELGGLGADNRIATVLRIHGGLVVQNACHDLRAIHMDGAVARGGVAALKALTRYDGADGSNYAVDDCCDYVDVVLSVPYTP